MENSELNSNLGAPNQMVGDFFVHTDFAPQGWVCPKCGHVMSPTTPVCPFCPVKMETQTTCTSASSFDYQGDSYVVTKTGEKEEITIDGRPISVVTVDLCNNDNEKPIHIY